MTLEKYKILICDDSILFRKQMKDYLTGLGCNAIIEATDGMAAITSYKENNPDLVFLDIIMPQKDGVEAISEIMSFDSNAYVVMFSSVGTQQNLKDAIYCGAKDFLQKPFDENKLRLVIEKFFEERGNG